MEWQIEVEVHGFLEGLEDDFDLAVNGDLEVQ